jgi:hypothetical protein
MDASLKIEHVTDLNTRNFRGSMEQARSTVTSLTSAGSVVGLVNRNHSPMTAAESPAPLTEQELHKSKTVAEKTMPAQNLTQNSAKRNNFMKK